MDYELVKFEELKGKTIISTEGMEKDSEEITFNCSDGSIYKMFHEQDCCESVWLEDVCGDPTYLIGSEILKAEESSNSDDKPLRDCEESHTWTYYKLATINGSVDLRWYGCSNGYYSESVNLYRIKDSILVNESYNGKIIEPKEVNINIGDSIETVRFNWKDQKIEFTSEELFEKLSKLKSFQ